ncbi:hypothetical protein AAMO2058_000192700 [Amorphochlora amoebiformis]
MVSAVNYAALSASIIAVLLTGKFMVQLAAWRAAEVLEKPRYDVISNFNGVELRKYKPYIVAEVRTGTPKMKQASSSGFRQVAGYIFGKNKVRKGDGPLKMKMTAPVRMESQSKDTSISFVMGSKYDLASLPKPMNKNVTLRQIAEHYLAVKKFSGPPPNEELVGQIRDQIRKTLNEKGLIEAKKDKTFLYQYHDPFATPNFLRKNEVGLELTRGSVKKILKE